VGSSPTFAETRIESALLTRSADFLVEPGGARATLIVEAVGRRGDPLGWIGVTLPAGPALPPAAAIVQRIGAHFAALE
jgi:hypothetical protein